MNNTSINNSNNNISSIEFNDLAKQLRLQRFDPEEIQYYKQTAIYGEKLRNKKKRYVITIQKFYRGYSVRKIIGKKLEAINNEAVIKFLLNKRKDRLKKRGKELIQYFLKDYVNKQREMKRVILFSYYHYCSNQISATYKGYKFRQTFKPYFDKYIKSRNTIFNLILFAKVRRIMVTTKIQEILLEKTKNSVFIKLIEDQNLDDLKKKIYDRDSIEESEEEYFNLKSQKLKQELIKRNIALDKIFYTSYYKFYLNGKWMKYFSFEINEGNNDDDNAEPKTKDNKLDFWVNWTDVLKKDRINKDDLFEVYNGFEFKVKKQRNVDAINTEDITNSLENKEDVDKAETNKDEEILNEVVDNEEGKEDEDPNDLRISVNPDDRVIKPSSGYNLDNLPDEALTAENQRSKTPVKNIEHIKRKKPKYDARKAIEEAKNQDKKPPSKSKQDRENFRAFLKANRGGNDQENDKSKPKKTEEEELEEELKDKLKNIESKHVSEDPSKPISKQTQKKETLASEKRRKLHEMEKKSRKVNMNKVKSKIDCWSQDNVTVPSYTQKRKAQEVRQIKFNPQILSRIETEINNIESRLSLENYQVLKEEKFKEVPIAYIKKESFYVKNYSPEIYDQLLIHLNKHYEELKN